MTSRLRVGPAIYRLAADCVLMLHLAFVVYAVSGGLLILVDPHWAWFHIPVVAWSAVISLKRWPCPLTPLEKRLRRAAGQTEYETTFVRHYIAPLVYPMGLPRRLELIAGVSVLVWNVIVYSAALAWISYSRNVA